MHSIIAKILVNTKKEPAGKFFLYRIVHLHCLLAADRRCCVKQLCTCDKVEHVGVRVDQKLACLCEFF